ncbi:hypothetical protein RCL1_002821 [Eukaryota sp. TZLM3-RCL]
MSTETIRGERKRAKELLLGYLTSISQQSSSIIALYFMSFQTNGCFSSSYIINRASPDQSFKCMNVSSVALTDFLKMLNLPDVPEHASVIFPRLNDLLNKIMSFVSKHSNDLYVCFIHDQMTTTFFFKPSNPNAEIIKLSHMIEVCNQSHLFTRDLVYKESARIVNDPTTQLQSLRQQYQQLETEFTEKSSIIEQLSQDLLEKINENTHLNEQLQEFQTRLCTIERTMTPFLSFNFHALGKTNLPFYSLSEIHQKQLCVQSPASDDVVSFLSQCLCTKYKVSFISSEIWDGICFDLFGYLRKYGQQLYNLLSMSKTFVMIHLGAIYSVPPYSRFDFYNENQDVVIGHYVLVSIEKTASELIIRIIDSLQGVNFDYEKMIVGTICTLLRFFQLISTSNAIKVHYPRCEKQSISSIYCGWFMLWNLYLFLNNLPVSNSKCLKINVLHKKLAPVLKEFIGDFSLLYKPLVTEESRSEEIQSMSEGVITIEDISDESESYLSE